MRIGLIEPRSADVNVFSKFPLPRLGLPLIGTILRDAGHDVKVYCEDLHALSPRDYWHLLGSDLIGISTTTSTAPRAYFLASVFRKAKKRVAIGGVHVTYMPDEALQHADYCVRGEGERTMFELVEALQGRGRLEDIAGLSFHADGKAHHNPPRPLEKDLNALPNPDFSLIAGHERMWLKPVATSRGCPYNCTFCSVTPMFGDHYRFLDPEQAVAALAPHSGHSVFIYDDNFTANKARAKEILRLMIKRRITPSWTAQTRADVARDPELISLMQRARCRALCIGFESINARTLAAMNKKQSVDDIVRCIRILHKHRISIHGMFVVGADTDDLNTIKDTVAFAKDNRIETVQFSIMTPLPGTPFFRQLESEGRIFTRNWSLYDGHHVVFWPKLMSPIELQLGMYHALRRFYSYSHCIRAMWRFQFVTAILRTYGVRGIKEWERSNAHFIEKLKGLAHKATAESVNLARTASAKSADLARTVGRGPAVNAK
jgi:radical SAM superfamily enzyme YgiQ (UPF0313 family)